MAVVAPIPRARQRTAAAVNPGFLASMRKPKRKCMRVIRTRLDFGSLTCYPSGGDIGAGDRIRTGNIDLGKVALYQLSYSRPEGKPIVHQNIPSVKRSL